MADVSPVTEAVRGLLARAAKAVAGAVAGAGVAFGTSLTSGDDVATAGVKALAGAIAGFGIVWVGPANAPKA